MNFNVSLFFNKFKTRIYANLYNKQYKINIQNVIIADINDFNTTDKFYTYCLKILQDHRLLQEIIEDEVKNIINEMIIAKQHKLQEKNINTLINNINNKNLSLNISL